MIAIPARVTFEWIVRTLPTLESAAQFEQLTQALQARQWDGAWPGENFYGLMFTLLPMAVKREVRARNREAA